MARRKIITIGASVIDAFVWSRAFSLFRSPKFVGGVGECFALGSKMEMEKFALATGGGATNAAATFARSGFRTSCLTAVGDDIFAAAILDDLETRGIGSELLVTIRGQHTAFSTILVMPSGERSILTHRGASEMLSPKLVPWKKVTGDWIYMTSLGGRLDLLSAVMRQAVKKKMRVFWNPGRKDILHGPAVLKPYLRQLAVLDVNREEAADLTKRPLHDLRGILRDLHHLSAGVLLTDGPKGAYWSDGEGTLHVEPTRVKPVNRTGAGDAFGSGFLSGFIRSQDPAQALRVGAANAEGVIQKIGAKAGVFHSYPSARLLAKFRVRTIDR